MTDEDCIKYSASASHALDLMRGKWTMQILCVMRSGPVRLGQLGRTIPAASKKVLTANLRELVSMGVVVRREFTGTVRHVEYDFARFMRQPMSAMLDHLAELGKFYNEKRLSNAGSDDLTSDRDRT